MSRRLSAASVLAAVVALVLAFITEHVANVGGVRCQVYCGPGVQTLPFGWMVATAAVWLVALFLSAAGLIASRARSTGAWLGIAVSTILPLLVAFLATQTASG
jgi:uncharacterized membrane protein YhaH (DUF805 family)